MIVRLEQRVANLERQNRKLQFCLLGIVAVVLVVSLAGAVMPHKVAGLIEAREFWVRDDNGGIRAIVNDAGVHYYDENGHTRATMPASGVTCADESGSSPAVPIGAGMLAYGRSYDAEGVRTWPALR